MSEHGFSNVFQIFNSNKDTIVTLQVIFTRYMIDYRESEREGPGLHEGPSKPFSNATTSFFLFLYSGFCVHFHES